jgi:hypothetical protein
MMSIKINEEHKKFQESMNLHWKKVAEETVNEIEQQPEKQTKAKTRVKKNNEQRKLYNQMLVKALNVSCSIGMVLVKYAVFIR